MPPKMVTCCICDKEVTKRSTLETAPGKRACRTHEKTQSMSRKKQEFEKQTEQIRQNKVKRRQEKLKSRNEPLEFKKNGYGDYIMKCHRCNREGIRNDIWAARALQDMSLKRISGEKFHHVLDMQTQHFKDNIGGPMLQVVPISHPGVDAITIRPEHVQMKHFAKVVVLCPECLSVCKIDVGPTAEQMKNFTVAGAIMGKSTDEQMVKDICKIKGIDLITIDKNLDKHKALSMLADHFGTKQIHSEACKESEEIIEGVWLCKCLRSNYIVTSEGVISP